MWIITKDIIDCGQAVGTTSPDYAIPNDLNEEKGYKFRMYDDDGNLY